jgi:hypothetical protein
VDLVVQKINKPDMKRKKEFSKRFNKGKTQWHYVDFEALEPLAKVLEYGAIKYGDEGMDPKDLNYRKPPKNKWVILDSLFRHVLALMKGEEIDQESGLHHTGHIMANAMFYYRHFGIKNKN